MQLCVEIRIPFFISRNLFFFFFFSFLGVKIPYSFSKVQTYIRRFKSILSLCHIIWDTQGHYSSNEYTQIFLLNAKLTNKMLHFLFLYGQDRPEIQFVNKHSQWSQKQCLPLHNTLPLKFTGTIYEKCSLVSFFDHNMQSFMFSLSYYTSTQRNAYSSTYISANVDSKQNINAYVYEE